MREIELTKNQFALVDDADYERVSQFKWYALETPCGAFYACRTKRLPNGGKTSQLMHRFILGLHSSRRKGDHKDGDGLNNQRNNLRRCSSSQNSRNCRKQRTGRSSRYKGVRWHKRDKVWTAQIQIHVSGESKFLGHFEVEEDAARAYDAAARKYFGRFARLNFPKKREASAHSWAMFLEAA
jgi:AP2 domain